MFPASRKPKMWDDVVVTRYLIAVPPVLVTLGFILRAFAHGWKVGAVAMIMFGCFWLWFIASFPADVPIFPS